MYGRNKIKETVHACIVRFFTAALFPAAVLFCSGCGGKTKDSFEELSVSEAPRDSAETPDVDSALAENADSGSGEDEPEGGNDTAATVFVYVCGAVNAPGVYELAAGARVFEAVALAGGMTEEASAESVNQARSVTDGEQIYVPTADEAKAQGTGVGENTVTEGTDKKININTAGKEELMTLTGIGEAKAQSILDYREEHGGFGSIEELMQIEGIKEGVFNKIKQDIMI